MKAEGRRQRAEGRTNRFLPSAFCLLPSAFIFLACAAPPNAHTTTIEFWGLGREGEVVAEMIPEFERRNPGIRVSLQQIPFIAAHEKLMTAHVGESSPDVAQIGNTWIAEFVTLRALEELDSLPLDQSDYFPGIRATNVVDGKLYGIPWYVDTRVLFYRQDLLADVGYPNGPRTWSEWLDSMEKLRRGRKSNYGILMPTNESEHIAVLAMSNGATFLNAEGTRGAFREPRFRDAFAFYVELFRRGYAPKVNNTQVANLYQEFAQANFAMYVSGPWNVGEFRRRLPAEMQDKWATSPLPSRDASAPPGVSMAGGSSLVVFRTSTKKAAARKLIEFLSEPAQQVRFYELCGDLPARRSAWRAPALANDPHLPAFRLQLERVAPFPAVPEWEQIWTTLYQHGEATVRGAMTPAAALADLDRTTDRILEKRRWVLARKRGVGVPPASAGHPARPQPARPQLASGETPAASGRDARPPLRGTQ